MGHMTFYITLYSFKIDNYTLKRVHRNVQLHAADLSSLTLIDHPGGVNERTLLLLIEKNILRIISKLIISHNF